MGQNVLNLGNASVELGLFVLGGIVLGIFGQVAVGAGFGDHRRDFPFTGGFQVIQFLLQVGKTQACNLIFLCHIQNPFSEKVSIAPNIIEELCPIVKIFLLFPGERMEDDGKSSPKWFFFRSAPQPPLRGTAGLTGTLSPPQPPSELPPAREWAGSC